MLPGNELKYVSECLKTNWISSSGSFLERFESEWAKYCGQKYGIAVCNGTVALELAVDACNFPKGSEIILPSFTIISCVQAVTKAGCKPVLVDCDSETYCMQVSRIEAKITDRTVAIMPVHMYGHPVEMKPIMDIAQKHGLVVIEDVAQTQGGEYRGKKCGSFGKLSCFSFYANKNITTGEGGMVLTSDTVIAQRLRKLKNLCFLKSPRFLHYRLGYNYRMTNIQAALGLAQLENIDRFIERKIDMAKKYSQALVNLPLQLPMEHKWAKNVIWMYNVLLKEDKQSQEFFEKDWKNISPEEYFRWPAYKLMKVLEQAGVQTRPFFIGMHEQPVFHEQGLFKGERYPVTEKIARSGFYLPSGQAITDFQIDEVSRALKEIFNE